jgi:hypothetical protein
MSDSNEQIMQLTRQQRLFLLGEEKLQPNLFGMHRVQVDAGQTWLLYRDGLLTRRLGPGRHSWWNGFLHEWRIQKINARVELLPIPVKGRVKGPVMPKEDAGGAAMQLACDVTAELEISCRIAQIENFLQYRDPLSVFIASIQNLVVEFIGNLSYDQYGQWAKEIRDQTKRRLQPGGIDDAERRVGIRVEDVFVTDFKPNTAHDRNMLSMYQLIERGKRELVEVQANAKRDTVVAASFAKQGEILNLAPAILALQNSPIGKALIDRDADLQRLMVATGLNPGVNVQPLQDIPGQLGSGQAPTVGYLKPPRPSSSGQVSSGYLQAEQVTGQISSGHPQAEQITGQAYPTDVPHPAQSPASALPQDGGSSPVDDARQKLELSNLESAGFMVAGRKGQDVPSYDDGRVVPGSKEWVLQVYAQRPNGYLEIVFRCPAGYPDLAPRVEVKPPTGGGRQQVEPNTIHKWNAGRLLVDVAREIAENTP